MENSGNQDAIGLGQIEHRVSTNLESAQVGLDLVACSPNRWIVCQKIEAFLDPAQVEIRLTPSPGSDCECGDFVDIELLARFGECRWKGARSLEHAGAMPLKGLFGR